MTFTQIITRYGEPELAYVHIEPCEEDRWYCTYSLYKPCCTRRLGRFYYRPPKGRDNYRKVLKRYVKFLEKYYNTMLFEQTIIKYGAPEVVYIHIEPRMDNRWYCTMSRVHPSAPRVLDMYYERDYIDPDDIKRVLKLYAKFLEDYYSL